MPLRIDELLNCLAAAVPPQERVLTCGAVFALTNPDQSWTSRVGHLFGWATPAPVAERASSSGLRIVREVVDCLYYGVGSVVLHEVT